MFAPTPPPGLPWLLRDAGTGPWSEESSPRTPNRYVSLLPVPSFSVHWARWTKARSISARQAIGQVQSLAFAGKTRPPYRVRPIPSCSTSPATRRQSHVQLRPSSSSLPTGFFERVGPTVVALYSTPRRLKATCP
jgi:hypothetical protein